MKKVLLSVVCLALTGVFTISCSDKHANMVQFSLYGTDLNIHFDTSQREAMKDVSKDEVSKCLVWIKSSTIETLKDCQRIKQELNLSDWAYVKMLDRFATANDGSIEFSAGDFNAITTPLQLIAFNRQAPESVEVSYSPYGEDNWSELSVEEVPEYYWPVMGWFYTGSLAGVTGQGLNGWFDLKIRLTDAAGNWQEQVISPAFRIDDLAYSSVVTITPDKVGDNAIYNLAGQRMRGGLESLTHGIYIVGGKKVVK